MNYNPLTSRTNWTVLVMFIIQYAPVLSEMIPEPWKGLFTAVLAILAFYFHVDGVKKFGSKVAAGTA